MVLVKIIRHSERYDYHNPLSWIFCFGHYWADTPLTKRGHRMAEKKGESLSASFQPSHIYTSPYNRTLATAVEIKKSFPSSLIIIEPLLAEYQPYYKHRLTLYPQGISLENYPEFQFPEEYAQFEKRVKFIIFKLIEETNGSDLLIVTHGEIIKFLIFFLQNLFPDLLLDIEEVGYLTTLSFEYDKEKKIILENTVYVT